MKYSMMLVLFLAFPVLADPPKPIKFPDPPIPVVPTPPPPTPSTPVQLNKGQIYVVSSDAPFLLTGSQEGLVKITALKVPITIYGEFVDPQPDDDKGRPITAGFAYVVKPIASGEVTLIASPDLTGNNIVRRKVQVNVAPIPPPIPPTPPVPPTPPADPFQATLQSAYSSDTDADKATSVAELKRLYSAAANLVPGAFFQTSQGVMKWIKDSETTDKLAATAIPNTRKAIGAELSKVLPAISANPLTDADKALLSRQFQRVSDAIGGLK